MLTIGKRDAVFRYFPNNKDMYWRTTPNLLLGLMFTLVSLGDSIIHSAPRQSGIWGLIVYLASYSLCFCFLLLLQKIITNLVV